MFELYGRDATAAMPLISEGLMNHALNEEGYNAREASFLGRHFICREFFNSLQVTRIPRQRRDDGILQLKCCGIYDWLCRER